MTDVVLQNGKGQADELESLAEKINAEHKACEEAAGAALTHALEAGRLLEEVKASLPHGEWGRWKKEHFAGSDRSARDYRRVWLNRELLGLRQNGSSAATLSLRQALKVLTAPKPKPPPRPLWVPQAPEGAQPDPQVLKELETEEEAAQALKRHNHEALAEHQSAERLTELCDIIKVLDQLVPKYPPEEAGAALAAWAGEGRGLTVLRDSIAWLQLTLEVAEREQGRMQSPE